MRREYLINYTLMSRSVLRAEGISPNAGNEHSLEYIGAR